MHFWLILIFLNILTTLQNEPKIVGVSVTDSNEVIFEEGIPKIFSSQKTLILYGVSLDKIINIYFVQDLMNFGDDCIDKRFPFNFPLIKNTSNIIFINYIKQPIFPLNKILYLCVGMEVGGGGVVNGLVGGGLGDKNGGIPQMVYKHMGNQVGIVFSSPHQGLPLPAIITFGIILIIFSGLFSGLNLGLMSLTSRELKIIISTGTSSERENARAVLPLRQLGNVLLCAILFGNTIVNSTTAILLENLTSGAIAVVLTTVIIVIFGEVIPQSICARYGLLIGAKTRYLTWFVIFITAPLSYPLGKLLDFIIGSDTPIMYNRNQLLEVVKQNCEGNLEADEAGIIYGALKFKSKTVSEIMTPLNQCYLVDQNSCLDFRTVSDIIKSGYSRIPVYSNNRSNITSLLHIKDLAFIDPDDMIPLLSVVNFYNHPLIKINYDTKLDIVFKKFKEGLAHMGIVTKLVYNSDGTESKTEAIGLVTLEDIIEEIIQSEICDETDIKTSPRDISNLEISKTINKHNIRQFFEKSVSSITEMTPNVLLSLCQFMSTAIECFKGNHISTSILSRLIAHPGVAIKREYSDHYFLYLKDVPADYFILIVEGRVEISIGSENLTFVQGPFSFYGHTLFDKYNQNTSRLSSVERIKHTFTPDFSLRILSDVVFLKINVSLYQIAVEATRLDKTRKLSEGEEKIDDIWQNVVKNSPVQHTLSDITPPKVFVPEIIIINNDEEKTVHHSNPH